VRRFHESLPAEAREALITSGWSPDRQVPVERWHDVLGPEGFVLSPLVADLIGSLGGLEITPAVMEGDFLNAPILFEPELAGSGSFDVALELKDMFDQDFYPVAEWITSSCVYAGSRGKVVDHHDVELLDVADSFEDALRVMLLADRPLTVLRTY
jgi:SUKH-3 immunity protein